MFIEFLEVDIGEVDGATPCRCLALPDNESFGIEIDVTNFQVDQLANSEPSGKEDIEGAPIVRVYDVEQFMAHVGCQDD